MEFIWNDGGRAACGYVGLTGDVQQTIELFREILMTIATVARLKYGGHSRGSGASYAEGYVKGLPRSHRDESDDDAIMSEEALMQQLPGCANSSIARRAHLHQSQVVFICIYKLWILSVAAVYLLHRQSESDRPTLASISVRSPASCTCRDTRVNPFHTAVSSDLT